MTDAILSLYNIHTHMNIYIYIYIYIYVSIYIYMLYTHVIITELNKKYNSNNTNNIGRFTS